MSRSIVVVLCLLIVAAACGGDSAPTPDIDATVEAAIATAQSDTPRFSTGEAISLVINYLMEQEITTIKGKSGVIYTFRQPICLHNIKGRSGGRGFQESYLGDGVWLVEIDGGVVVTMAEIPVSSWRVYEVLSTVESLNQIC